MSEELREQVLTVLRQALERATWIAGDRRREIARLERLLEIERSGLKNAETEIIATKASMTALEEGRAA